MDDRNRSARNELPPRLRASSRWPAAPDRAKRLVALAVCLFASIALGSACGSGDGGGGGDGSPGGDGGGGGSCGNGTCDDSENCARCPGDCGACADPCPPAGCLYDERFELCDTPAGQLVHVDAAANASGSGGADDPYATLAEAVEAAASGATIRIAAGTYAEAITIEDKALHLCGGYAAGFGSRAPGTNVTELVGSGDQPVVTLLDARHTSLQGLRIRGGHGGVEIDATAGGSEPLVADCTIEDNQRPESERGGGVYCHRSDTLTLIGNTIRGNEAGRGGGVAVVHTDELIVNGNIVENNDGSSDHGGGLYLDAAIAEVSWNIIRGNAVGTMTEFGWGGGVIFFAPDGYAHFSHNIVTDNHAPSDGGGTFIDEGASALLENELIYANRCSQRGGAGLYVDGGATVTTVTLVNSTIAEHPCPGTVNGGNGIYASTNTDVTVRNSIFWNNEDDFYLRDGSTLAVSYSLSEEGYEGPGNVSADPLFADPAGGDFHLQSTAGRYSVDDAGAPVWQNDSATSPAIDAGDTNDDFSNEPAPNGGVVNMGAYGNTPEASRSP